MFIGVPALGDEPVSSGPYSKPRNPVGAVGPFGIATERGMSLAPLSSLLMTAP